MSGPIRSAMAWVLTLGALLMLLGVACGGGARDDPPQFLTLEAPVAAPIPNGPLAGRSDGGARFENDPVFTFDESGVVQYDYGEASFGIRYNPVTVANYAQALYGGYLQATDSEARNEFREKHLIQADWLVDNLVDKGDYGVWQYDFDYPLYDVKAPWVSAMGQGQGIIILIQAHSMTGDPRYLDAATKALRAFLVNVEDGGVRLPLSENAYWYEEYAAPGAKVSMVLNGFLFGLEGAEYYYDYTGAAFAKEIRDAGLRALRQEIPKYDTGSWSYYDQTGRPAKGYHGIHIRQLRHFHERTGDPVLGEYADKFQEYAVLAGQLEAQDAEQAPTPTEPPDATAPPPGPTWEEEQMTSLSESIIRSLVVAQLPTTLPPPDSYGWPMPAFKMAITTHQVGFTERAEQMAAELWELRAPNGLWVNWRGDTDIVNPIYATILYEQVGRHDRAMEVYRAALVEARSGEPRAYNTYWWPTMASIVVGEPMPLDLFVRAAPGFAGAYASYENDGMPSEHGRFYADVMAAYWRMLGGASIPLYRSDWCDPENQPEQRKTMWRECQAFYQWAEGRRFLPVLVEPYGFMNDDLLFMAFPGLPVD